MQFTIKRWIVSSVVLGAGGFLLWNYTRPSPPSAQSRATPESMPAVTSIVVNPRPVESPTVAEAKPVPPAPRETVAFVPMIPRTEVEATHQMVAAHAVLHEPRIADPASAENRIILQTMISKALATRPPAAAR